MYQEKDPIVKDFKELYEQGYRCILYEIDEQDQFFTVHLKNFKTESIRILKCNEEEGTTLKRYIDEIS